MRGEDARSHFALQRWQGKSDDELGWGMAGEIGTSNSSSGFYAALSASSLPVHHCFWFSEQIELSRRLCLNDLRVRVCVCCF